MNGFLVLDKPGGMTSRDALNRVQRWFPKRTKIGHTGTLDPLATGVLVVCIGAATRLADRIQAMPKSYDSRIRLGATSSTDDADGEIEVHSATPPSREQLDAAIAEFIGTIDQLPPAFSALKVGGRRAHDLARKGENVPLAPRAVTITAIRLTQYEWPFVDVSIDCGKGTYIRSVARDLGEKLGVGGMVESLRRTRVGPFAAEFGVTLETGPDEARSRLQPMLAALAELPQVSLTVDEERRFRQGQMIATHSGSGEAAVLGEHGDLIGIGGFDGGLHPRVVLNG
ncbi:MAG: tRNA pseudouridine(55) synthase TruB [Gemmataceae bacterium]